MAKNTYSRLLCGPQTLSELCCSAQCSLFVTFIHCRHNSIVYGVSKQLKYHTIYSKFQCSEQDNLQTLPPCSTSTPISHKRLHLTNGRVWLNDHTCTEKQIHLCIYILSSIYNSVFHGGKRIRYLTTYFHVKGLTSIYSREARDDAFGWDNAFQTGKTRIQLQIMIMEFYVDLIFRPQCGPTIDPTTHRNKSLFCLLEINQKFA